MKERKNLCPCPWMRVIQWAKRNEIIPVSQGFSTV
jgi:hypothetical protein